MRFVPTRAGSIVSWICAGPIISVFANGPLVVSAAVAGAKPASAPVTPSTTATSSTSPQCARRSRTPARPGTRPGRDPVQAWDAELPVVAAEGHQPDEEQDLGGTGRPYSVCSRLSRLRT